MVDDGAFSIPARTCGDETGAAYAVPVPVRACGGGETGAAYTIPCEDTYEGVYAFPCGACGAACGACGAVCGAALADTVGPDAPFTLSRVVA